MITILCVAPKSNYYCIPGLDLWNLERNAYLFTGHNPVITHAPCAQWSRNRSFSKIDIISKELAVFCFNKVIDNGGIFEHPAGSYFFKYINASRSNIISVDQSWWGFPARKRTYLYFNHVKPLSFNISFDCPVKTVVNMHSTARSIMPLSFCQWLVDCVTSANILPIT